MNEIRPVAFITGSSRGIGLACALKLAEAGYDIALNDRHNSDNDAVIKAKEQIDALGVRCIVATGDIADISAHELIVDKVMMEFGRLDCLVNNAGTGPLRRGDLLEVSPDSWDHCLNLNSKGLFFLSQRCAKLMLEQEKNICNPCIINITSCSAKILSPSRAEYCVSKAAASMASRLLALRLATTPVRVLEIRPGIIQTKMTAIVADKYDKLIANGLVPQKRWGRPEDIAITVASFAKGNLPYTVGQIIDIDGGLNLQNF